MDAHPLQFVEIVSDGLRGVVRQERMLHADGVHAVEEVDGEGEQIGSEIDGPVHVEGEMLDFRELFLQFRVQGLVMVFFHLTVFS